MNVRRPTLISTLILAAAVAFGGASVAQAAPAAKSPKAPTTLTSQVDHALSMLPRYTVFDNIAFKVKGTKVILLGQVTEPVKKEDAENAAKGVSGVTQVVNKIQVLPLSPMDDQTRQAEFHAIYDYPSLQRYGLGSLHAIRIIVDNGHVTLVGIVNSKTDSDTASIRANGVPGVFSVTNNLVVQPS
ncbi:MAG: BON domain-containing protein [Candidatus Acidiferrales bacterium]